MPERSPKKDLYMLQPVGILHGDILSRRQAPKNYTESAHQGVIEIYPEYQDAIQGISAGDTLVVLFWLHEARRDILQVHPRGDTSIPIRGVFSTRSPVRPNPVAISELQVTGVNNNRITVTHVDVLDKTPVIDIKKKI